MQRCLGGLGDVKLDVAGPLKNSFRQTENMAARIGVSVLVLIEGRLPKFESKEIMAGTRRAQMFNHLLMVSPLRA